MIFFLLLFLNLLSPNSNHLFQFSETQDPVSWQSHQYASPARRHGQHVWSEWIQELATSPKQQHVQRGAVGAHTERKP